MSEAPFLELKPAEISDLDNTNTHGNGSANGGVSSDKPQITKERILNSEVGDRSKPSGPCRAAANVVHHSLICTSHTICLALLTTLTAAQSAMDAVANHPTTQNIKQTVVNGEVCRTGSLICNSEFGANSGLATQMPTMTSLNENTDMRRTGRTECSGRVSEDEK